MSIQGKKTAERLKEFMQILCKYNVSSVYGHYLNVVVELEPEVIVSDEDKLKLNSLDGFNDLKTNIWQLYYC
jgi:hypothetical protein